jgi:deoxyribodipyrimidine photo-lyase
VCVVFHIHQPWWIGADWYHHHLIDSDVGINYTQWQSQAGLIGKPSQRVYNPRKQVRDHDPDGEWIGRWVPELRDLPSRFLDRPERTPLAAQDACGVTMGEDYPLPVVDFEARREAFWTRYERLRPEAARALARPDVAKRASFSGGYL